MSDEPIYYIRKKRILEELDIDSATLWKWEKSGQFPAGVVLNPNPGGHEIRAWNLAEYEEWKRTRPVRMARPARKSPYPTGPTGPRKKKPTIGRPE